MTDDFNWIKPDGKQRFPMQDDTKETAAHPVFAFLLGSGPLDGVWFGADPPDGKPRYWWRNQLRAALSSSSPGGEGERNSGAAGASYPAQQAWRPMASAPKDHAAILGYQGTPGDNEGRMAVVWHNGQMWSCADYPGLWPTHWMPLPSPPEQPPPPRVRHPPRQ